MSEGWRNGLVLGALGLALLLNVVALLRIGDLRNELAHRRANASDIAQLRRRLTMTDQRIEELERGQQWVINQDWTIGGNDGDIDCRGTVPVVASWSFREIAPDAAVSVQFRANDGSEWRRFDAQATGLLDYRTTAELALDKEWEYRIVAKSEDAVRATEPKPASELARLTDRRLFFEYGETLSDDDGRWVRFILESEAARLSPCNRIADAEVEIYQNDELVRTIEMQPEHPGDHPPQAYNPEPDTGSLDRGGASASDSGSVLVMPKDADERSVWWTDWVEMGAEYQPVAVVEFLDGTTRRLEQIGPH